MYLFVDFDGVLRPDWAERGRFHRPCLERFEATLRDYPQVHIVISSDWRWQMRFTTLVGLFAADIGARIVGVTPLLPSDEEGMRYREIVSYLEQRVAQEEATPGTPLRRSRLPPWLAIDDRPELFTRHVIGREVLITDPARAFDAAFEARLRAAIAARGESS